MKNMTFTLTLLITTFDYPLAVGIVTFIPFLVLAMWIAVRFWSKEYVTQWKLVLREILKR
jgi:hypothetical protein